MFPLFVSSPFFYFDPHPVPTFTQAIPSHGFHQFKSNSLDVLQRRIEEQQVCPSVRCLSCLIHQNQCPLLTLSSQLHELVLDSHLVLKSR